MRATSKRPSRGTTLIEAMIATLILAIGMVGFSSAMLGASTADSYNDGRAYAMNIAEETAGLVKTWDYNTDARLAANCSWTSTTPDFSSPTVGTFTIAAGPPPSVTETLSTTPDFNNAAIENNGCSAPSTCPFGGRTLAQINKYAPGSGFIFNRWMNVMQDPNNSCLKIVAVIVTYQRGISSRGSVTAITGVSNNLALGPSAAGTSTLCHAGCP